ncbi:MAG TPA: hypothetical protein VM348_01205, partial [Brevundimonas sp.]|nr:hypothetical protein [Brevundimonas sp.]
MRGNERRITREGRRAVDRRKGPPSWLRIALLTVTLALAVCVLLFAREIARPGQEADALRLSAVDREARLLALDLETRIAPVEAAIRAAAIGTDPPSVMLQRARAASPDAAFAVLDGIGRPVATTGGDARLFAAEPGRPRLAADGRAILVSRSLAGGPAPRRTD